MISAENISQALDDYNRYIDKKLNYGPDFCKRFANSALIKKSNLKKMLSKHPGWDESLWAVKVPIELKQEVDFDLVHDLLFGLFNLNTKKVWGHNYEYDSIAEWVACVATDRVDKDNMYGTPTVMTRLFPNAWHKGRKLIRIIREMLVEHGVWTDKPGDFQKMFAQLSEAVTPKMIKTTLFISINPCHFLTMSNPKFDDRGEMLTSCHSINNLDYDYNNGCVGYARDNITMICFTVNNPNDKESLNNRKTSRQLFMYEPGSNILLQSRMYTSDGGTRGNHIWSKVFFKAVIEVLDKCEQKNEVWYKRNDYHEDDEPIRFTPSDDFGGYPDWVYEEFCPMIAYRKSINIDKLYDHPVEFFVGSDGLCLCCGARISTRVYCISCEDKVKCKCCHRLSNRDSLFIAYDSSGAEVQVCVTCLTGHFTYCTHCHTYHEDSVMYSDANGKAICQQCITRYFRQCPDCGMLYRREETVWDEEHGVWRCRNCHHRHEEE